MEAGAIWSPVFLENMLVNFVLFSFRARAGALPWAWLLQLLKVLLPAAPGKGCSPVTAKGNMRSVFYCFILLLRIVT